MTKVWQPIETAPRNAKTFWGRGDDVIRKTWYGKASHVPMYGWCYIPDRGGAEDVTLWDPTEWSERS